MDPLQPHNDDALDVPVVDLDAIDQQIARKWQELVELSKEEALHDAAVALLNTELLLASLPPQPAPRVALVALVLPLYELGTIPCCHCHRSCYY